MTRLHSIAILGAALVFPFLGLGTWYAATYWGDREEGFGLVPRETGFYELTPPSRLFPPGTIGTVEKLANGSLRLHLTCNMDEQALESLWAESPTMNRNLVSRIADGFKASAEALNAIASKAMADRVRQIDMSFEDIHILTMSHENLLKVRNQYLKGDCEQVIIGNLTAGARVCQTEEVLRADVAYRLSFKQGISGEEKAGAAERFVQEAGLEVDKTEDDEMRGEDLYFGIKVDLICFKLNNETNRVTAANFH